MGIYLESEKLYTLDTLYLDRLEERLSAGVVIGRARTAHALDAADGRDLAPKVPRGVLAAAIETAEKSV